MASHWPVIVGINQYQSLQPLMYAQFDALELRDFLVNEVGLPAAYCSLLTDISPMVYQGAAAPTREVLLQRLIQSCDRAGPEDTVWFFFSGYGVQWQGQDYLLPIDADPNQIEQTGLLVETLLHQLVQGKQRQSIVMLDINRPQSALAIAPGHQGLGAPSMALAQTLNIPLVLSCQPDQFSQETLAVRHGLFTEALIEGMRFHGCLTLAQLVDYLRDRVPELCQHHWRPVQNPVAVLPPGQQYAMLVPPSLVGQMPVGVPPEPEITPSPSANPDLLMALPAPTAAAPTAPGLISDPLPSQVLSAEPVVEPPPAEGLPPGKLPSPNPSTELTSGFSPATDSDDLVPWWKLGILAVAGLLLLGVLWRNQDSLVGQPSTDPVAPAPVASPSDTSAPEVPSPSGEGSGETLFPSTSVSGAEALERARNALAQRQFGEALVWFEQIPEGERPVDYEALVNQAKTGYANASLSGEAALNQARRLIEPLSASLFNDAIEQARQVPAGDPAYAQAQADIERWSLVIIDLAEGRAASGDLDGAISAARLVPEDPGEIWSQAQARIQQWEQRQVNRRLLQEAQNGLQPDQA
ncbi:MAG: caspase family protein, partial [Nodosilinea sp.]